MLRANHATFALFLGVGLVGCQTTPAPTTPAPIIQKTVPVKKPEATQEKSPTARQTPYPGAANGPLQTAPLPGSPASSAPRPTPPQPTVNLRDGSNIPAFRNLIVQAQQQIQDNDLDNAEQTLIQAQRMAPQSTAVYAYLSEVAIKKRQGNNAEAMARKGLMLTSNPRQQRAFWQLILSAAQLQNNSILAEQAKGKIQQLSNQ